MKYLSASLTVLAFLLLAAPLRAEQEPGPLALEVPGPLEDGSNIDPQSYDGSVADRDWSRQLRGSFRSAMVGRYLDPDPARRLAGELRSRGISAFVLTKMFEESKRLGSDPVGIFYVVMAGLFGQTADADFLGQRLRAEGVIKDFRTLAVDDPGEIQSVRSQNQALYSQGEKVSRDSRDRAAKPLAPTSPAESGAAFKKQVYGRYVGSYRDPLEAREVARKMSGSGWSASVERDGQWNRVYLAPTEDHRDFKADEKVLREARRSAARQSGLFIVADLSSLKGSFNPETPSKSRDDASACAGFSEAGRLAAALNRTIIYVPEGSFTAALIPVLPESSRWAEIKQKVKDIWGDDKEVSPPPGTAAYGPSIYRRPEMEAAISRLSPSPNPASLARHLPPLSRDLAGVPGTKIVIVFSEFVGPDTDEELLKALASLKDQFGSSLRAVFVYGDTNGRGYLLSQRLAKEAGGHEAWDACRLLADNAYFERYIKSIFQ